MFWTFLVLGGILVLAFLVWTDSARRLRRRDDTVQRLSRFLADLGARKIDDATWVVDGRRYRIDVRPPVWLSDNCSLRIGLYTPRRFNFALGKDLEVLDGDASRVREWMEDGTVKLVLERAVRGRWAGLEQRGLQMALVGNRFRDRDLRPAGFAAILRALRVLDRGPEDRPRGGFLTFRSGFESDVPPWHWTPDAIQRLPRGVRRFVVAYSVDAPELAEPLVELLLELCGAARPSFLVDLPDVSFVEHAFGRCYVRRGSILETGHAQAVVAADRFMDGRFFQGFVGLPKGGRYDQLEKARRYEFHELALAALPDLALYARRLLDDEGAWHSGEIEVLTVRLGDGEIVRAVEQVAGRFGARIVRTDRRFNPKLLPSTAGKE